MEQNQTLEALFEQSLSEILVNGKSLLEAEAIHECVVNGTDVTITIDLPNDSETRAHVSSQIENRLTQIEGIEKVHIRYADAGQSTTDTAGSKGSVPRPAEKRPTRQSLLDNYQTILAVGSGKGGVGKSTVALNLAITLQQLGNQVSLFDADIYGPSMPIMMGLRSVQPTMEGEKRIIPLHKHGIDMLSIGNLVEEAAATIWRGPIVHRVIEQLLEETVWPGGDFMIIDLPPGTGDVQLTLSQVLDLSGAVIVSTPQDVALLDAIKAVSMFRKVEIPIVGMVENMSTFICPHCGEHTAIFASENAEQASHQNNIPFLGKIPLELEIRKGGDSGQPIAVSDPNSGAAKAFRGIAECLLQSLHTTTS